MENGSELTAKITVNQMSKRASCFFARLSDSVIVDSEQIVFVKYKPQIISK